MNIIFLDVDEEKEIKNHDDYCEETKEIVVTWPLNERTMLMLRTLIKETNSFIVVSSSLKKNKEYIQTFLEKLEKYKLLDRMIGYTYSINNNREVEILNFLKQLHNDVKFIIMSDDINRFSKLKNYVVEIDDYQNLLEEQLKKTVALFKMQEEGKI